MHHGTVCQLSYQGGGSLIYKNFQGKSKQISFAKAPYLRIGQAVSFSIDRKEAVAIAPTPEVTSRIAFPATSRKFQRSMCRFHNADVEEKLRRIANAEECLRQLLQNSELDGNALCALVVRCAGWLHAPVLPIEGRDTDRPDVQPHKQSEVQVRVRKLLISALSSLDLADPFTRQQLETPIDYLRILLRKFEGGCQEVTTSRAARQWRQLQCLMTSADAQRPTRTFSPEVRSDVSSLGDATHLWMDKVTPLEGEAESESLVTEVVDKHMAASSRLGVYRPNQKVMKLPTVFQADRPIELKCSQCPQVITSNWFWRHPGSGKVHVLVPQHGHRLCATKLGKKCPWLAQGDIPQKNDHSSELNFCVHNRQINLCKECGGRYICPHNLRTYRCSLCKHRFQHRRRQVAAKMTCGSHQQVG
eukprot:Skav214268  [mRNA]  locus=scaffold642:49329:50579:+ [translate_table: standard]